YTNIATYYNYTIYLHDALPISEAKLIIMANMRKNVGTPEAIKKMSESKKGQDHWSGRKHRLESKLKQSQSAFNRKTTIENENKRDRKSTRLNSCHVKISYAVFC